MIHLGVLLMSHNQLSGELFDDWSRLKSMLVVDLANNNLHGKIPTTIGLSTSLNILKLENNNLHGEIPKSLQNCSLLKSIDLSGNGFLNGDLPSWIGVAVSELRLLNLRSNNFSGTIPRQWCNLHFLRIFDLSNNRLFGEVPSCLYNWTSFVHGDNDYRGLGFYQDSTGLVYYSYEENTRLVMKGREYKYYNTIVKLVLTIDLSMNKLSGEIPNEITKLIHLFALNLSWNALVGTIPENIGAMTTLQTLDLSQNHLSGRIPNSLASLNFLTHLNMSFNNLTGKIPTGNQIQTLEDPSIYEGNPSLCGPPLKIKCPGDENSNNTPISTRDEEDGKENDSEMLLGFYISVAIGFPVGLNILFFIIFTNEARRIFYFRFIDRVNYNILQTIDSLTRGLRRMIMWRRSY
ncbi:serine/threonine-protein kinase BRI1-like 2 [Cucumis melo var. makuwa]|uniref:Serine/threonine-protein kinase BRI1-like 2 n=1 Tax=Cucumis melo var. makuwa TaxID=1194695 RepID=A0A5A7UJP7_CUCMM|nr:serine/threonine-protein kinase BRI1-like 2 [Cucumis melo var. makuwa]